MIEGLTFDEEGHIYRMRGLRIPSVTQVIDGALKDLSHIPRDVLERARHTGELVHAVTEYDAHGELDEDTVDDSIKGYLAAFRKFVAEKKPTFEWSERLVYHSMHGYAGKPDHMVVIDGERGPLDKKSGVVYKSDVVQVAAYFSAMNCMQQDLFANKPGAPMPWCNYGWALYLKENGTYRLEKFGRQTLASAFHVFSAARQCYRFREGI